MLKPETIMSALEKEDKRDRLRKAKVRAASNDPVVPLRPNESDGKIQSDAERQAAELRFTINRPFSHPEVPKLTWRPTKPCWCTE